MKVKLYDKFDAESLFSGNHGTVSLLRQNLITFWSQTIAESATGITFSEARQMHSINIRTRGAH